MKSRYWFRAILGLLGLLGGLFSLHGHAEDVRSHAGRLLWDMGDLYWEFSDKRMTRRLSPEALDRLATRTADKLASRRDGLEELLPDLRPERLPEGHPDIRFADDLKRFLDTWPDAAAFKASLLREGQNEVQDRTDGMARRSLLQELGGLKGGVPDPRWRWKTPFPFFRP